jgi:hypothetical protein
MNAIPDRVLILCKVDGIPIQYICILIIEQIKCLVTPLNKPFPENITFL